MKKVRDWQSCELSEQAEIIWLPIWFVRRERIIRYWFAVQNIRHRLFLAHLPNRALRHYSRQNSANFGCVEAKLKLAVANDNVLGRKGGRII
jgi:hypothetical protein